jgi:hypothetical protein
MWEVEVTGEFQDWYENLNAETQAPIQAAVNKLQTVGPTLGRPLVDTLTGASVHNLKELRPLGTSIRVLFAFDPRRAAILLLGADKAAFGWSAWYQDAIDQAERLYTEYLDEIRKDGLIE